ncbi:endonuclease/exonuclease/phosphatase family protein, partial [Trifolium medium]|nr:endonuclease/exonuclease/phosphatase family protein [Trifolium medium]
MERWPECIVWGLDRSLSDNCPIMLINKVMDWGHKPFKMLKCWRDVEGYQDFVRDKWKEIKVEGWGGYVLKEKFKAIKKELKEWHKNHCSNLDERILKTKEKLNSLDLKCQEAEINESDIQERAEMMEEFFKLSDLNCSIKWKKARMHRLKEGDANTRFFHNCVNNRRRTNTIHCIEKKDALIEDMKEIKE